MNSKETSEQNTGSELTETQGSPWLIRLFGWVTMLSLLGGFFVLCRRARSVAVLFAVFNEQQSSMTKMAFGSLDERTTVTAFYLLLIVLLGLNLIATFASESKRNLALITLSALGCSMLLFFVLAIEIPYFQLRSKLSDNQRDDADRYMPSFIDSISLGLTRRRPQAPSPAKGASGKKARAATGADIEQK